MSRSNARKNYREVEFDTIKFLNSGKLINLSLKQNTLEVDLGNLGLVEEIINDDER